MFGKLVSHMDHFISQVILIFFFFTFYSFWVPFESHLVNCVSLCWIDIFRIKLEDPSSLGLCSVDSFYYSFMSGALGCCFFPSSRIFNVSVDLHTRITCKTLNRIWRTSETPPHPFINWLMWVYSTCAAAPPSSPRRWAGLGRTLCFAGGGDEVDCHGGLAERGTTSGPRLVGYAGAAVGGSRDDICDTEDVSGHFWFRGQRNWKSSLSPDYVRSWFCCCGEKFIRSEDTVPSTAEIW